MGRHDTWGEGQSIDWQEWGSIIGGVVRGPGLRSKFPRVETAFFDLGSRTGVIRMNSAYGESAAYNTLQKKYMFYHLKARGERGESNGSLRGKFGGGYTPIKRRPLKWTGESDRVGGTAKAPGRVRLLGGKSIVA